ncbi:unnamed protein product [Adineta ricciae]|uniref:Solute carrier organic anion transporter family member n=1 Tax=Adineta ricciae TaxID=249248 RepID=A0A815LKS9_ADIRI|nr:unnamed protein product [Adineta ricciae]
MSDNIEIVNPNEQRKCSFHTIRSYFILLCFIVLCQSMITSAYLSSIISSIENYYGYSTELIGIALSSYDLVSVISIPLFSFIGSKFNRAKLISFGSFFFALGNILFILPYFINGYDINQLTNQTKNSSFDEFCSPNISIESLYEPFTRLSSSWSYYVIILSMIIMSIGSSPFYTLGITYLTDHLNKDDQPIYTGILYGMVALGPGIGFVLGSYFGSKWININDEIDSFDLNQNDPRWIGRWWAGFLISSTSLFFLSIILFTFPSSLSNHSQLQQTNQNESSTNFQVFRKNFIELLKNVTYISISLINAIENILVVLFTTYLIKYIESVFNYSSSYSSILTGLILLPSAILGTISGGFLVRRFHLTIFGCIKLIFISCLISLISLILILFLKCQSNIRYSFDDQCSQKCHCSSLIYEPVCYENQINYLSPCYAGCTNKNQTNYLNCHCLSNGTTVEKGLCENNCQMELIFFFVILFLVTFFETLMATPQLMIILRSTTESLQSFGLGLENCLMKILSQIPTPILFGILIDKQCLFWSKSSLFNHSTSCLIYNQKQFSFTLFLTIILIKIISFFFISFLFLFHWKKQKSILIENSGEREHLLNNSSTDIQ